jgi:DNA polymerase III alpha subunit
MLNLLSSRIEKPDKLQKYIREARLMELEVRPPGVNSSGLGFSKVDNTTIGFGLNAIQGIGKTQTEKILEAKGDQPFASIDDFFSRIDRSKVNSKVTATLAMAGAFDEFGYEREALVERLPEITEYYKKLDAWYDATIRYETREREIAEWEVEFEAWNKMKKEGLAVKLPEAVVDEELGRKVYWSPPRPKKPVKVKLKDKPAKFDLSDILRTKKKVTRQMVNWEAQYCKFFISAHPLDFITIPEDVQYNLTEDIGKSSTGQLLVAVSNIEERKIKNGKNKGRTMATITVQDHSGYAEVTVFAKHYEGALQEELEVGKVVYFPYRVDDATGSIPKVKLAGAMMCI